MVMRFEQGMSLEVWLRNLGRPPTQEELDRITRPLLGALEAMHAQNFLHRDIAPDNVIIRNDDTPVLLDFGSARRAIAEHTKTITGMVKGGYSPQEQYASDARLQGPWTDIYAFGATLYRAVTGAPPDEATLRGVEDRLKPLVETMQGNYRASFLAAVDACLKVKPADRPQSLAALREILYGPTPGLHISPTISIRPAQAGRRADIPKGRLKTWAWSAIGVVVVSAAALGFQYSSHLGADQGNAIGKATNEALKRADLEDWQRKIEAEGAQIKRNSLKKKAEEEQRQAEELRLRAQADAEKQRQDAEERQRLQAEAESKRKAELEEQRRKAEVEEGKRKKAEAEEARRRQAEIEERRLKTEADRKRLVEIEENRQKLLQAEVERQRQAETERRATQQPVAVPGNQAPSLGDPIFVRTLQSELKRVGCYLGDVDGQWGPKAKDALKEFARLAKHTFPLEAPQADVLDLLAKEQNRLCPLHCTGTEFESQGKCVQRAVPKPSPQPSPRAVQRQPPQEAPTNPRPKDPRCIAYGQSGWGTGLYQKYCQ